MSLKRAETETEMGRGFDSIEEPHECLSSDRI